MKVKLLAKAIVAKEGSPYNGDVVEAGEVVELDDAHAEHLIAQGAAEKASSKSK